MYLVTLPPLAPSPSGMPSSMSPVGCPTVQYGERRHSRCGGGARSGPDRVPDHRCVPASPARRGRLPAAVELGPPGAASHQLAASGLGGRRPMVLPVSDHGAIPQELLPLPRVYDPDHSAVLETTLADLAVAGPGVVDWLVERFGLEGETRDATWTRLASEPVHEGTWRWPRNRPTAGVPRSLDRASRGWPGVQQTPWLHPAAGRASPRPVRPGAHRRGRDRRDCCHTGCVALPRAARASWPFSPLRGHHRSHRGRSGTPGASSGSVAASRARAWPWRWTRRGRWSSSRCPARR